MQASHSPGPKATGLTGTQSRQDDNLLAQRRSFSLGGGRSVPPHPIERGAAVPTHDPSSGGEGEEAQAGEPQGRQPESPSAERVEEEIRREILALHIDSYGRGATNVKVYLLEELVVVLLEGLELQPNEEFMIENGHHEAVISTRHQFQKAIGPQFVALVERATGRRVNGFTSHVEVDGEPYAIEVFRLET
jgi:uncharacterized protein YbcI